MSSENTKEPWSETDNRNSAQALEARKSLTIWPLDESNTVLLNEVAPRNYTNPNPHDVYDLVAIGAGAGGLVSSKQSARRGAKSAMISDHLAGGDCLNVGCVPSKALIRCGRAAAEARRLAEFGVTVGPVGGDQSVSVDFGKVMERMRQIRATIAPADGHEGTSATGAHVFQGLGKFTGQDTIQVSDGSVLKFKKAVIATGGRAALPIVEGLKDTPFTTNAELFNLETLPSRMVILGSGVVALEMAQTFASFGSHVTVVQRASYLFQSKGGDPEASQIVKDALEEDGVTFLSETTTQNVETLRDADESDPKSLPLMKLTVKSADGTEQELECECLLVATGRLPNVENIGLEEAGVDYDPRRGVIINDLAQSSNPNVYAVGDCAADVPRLTHVSGEMAKVVVNNALFDDAWKISSLVVPAVMYTHPEVATVGIASEDMAEKAGVDVDVYRAGLEHNDRAITEGDRRGFVKIVTEKGGGKILGATIVAGRAGEIINEVSLAMKHDIGLDGIGRNIHSYPTTGEAVMGCGLQFINARWKRLD